MENSKETIAEKKPFAFFSVNNEYKMTNLYYG